MAPFITHFLVAEQVWPLLPALCQPHYGQFCFGCVAPDVDKVSAVLTQKDTHFFDRTTGYDLMASHRSATFVQRQADFFSSPFERLSPAGQTFALGYLCHLCVDEVSKYMWQRPTWLAFSDIGPGPAFAALDEYAKTRMACYPAVVQAVQNLPLPTVIPAVSAADWLAFYSGLVNFVQAGATELEFLALVDMFDQLPRNSRQQRLLAFRANIDAARERVHVFNLPDMVAAGTRHTAQRIEELLARRVALPGFPKLG